MPQLHRQCGEEGEVAEAGDDVEEGEVVIAVAAGEVGAAGQQPVPGEPRRVANKGEGDAKEDAAIAAAAA